MSASSWRTPYGWSFMVEGRPHRHEVFCTQLKKRVSSPFQKHENCRRRRGKLEYCIAWKRLAAYTLLPTAVAGGRGVVTNLTPHSL